MLIGGEYNAAQGNKVNGLYLDQYRATGSTPDGAGTFTIDLTGTVGTFGDIVGPTNPTGGQSATWQAAVAWEAAVPVDTQSFQYEWYLDGNLVSTQRSYSTQFNEESGTQHTLMAVAERMDGTRDTISRSLTVGLDAAWDGPTELSPGENGVFQAVMYGARYPLSSCQWWVDNTPLAGSSCTLTRSWGTPSTTYALSVIATDARGYSAQSLAWGVHIGSGEGGGNCQPPECYETFRVPPKSAKQPPPKRPLAARHFEKR
jgi:hypothetical protein